MRSDLGLIAAGAVIGLIAWPGFLPAALLLPAVLWLARNRTVAALSAAAYYLAASRGIPEGAGVFFGAGHFGLGLVLWLAVAALNAAVWAILWKRRYGVAIALLVTAVSPVGWSNPVTAAGMLFPGLGWTGLALTVIAASCLVDIHKYWKPLAGIATASVLALTFLSKEIREPDRWVAVNTDYGRLSSGGAGDAQAYARNLSLITEARWAIHAGARVILMPETVAGPWAQATRRLWATMAREARQSGVVVLVGAELPSGSGYRNGLQVLGAETGFIRQRIPVPVSMWAPWRAYSAQPDLTGSGVAHVAGHHVATLVCYEQVLVLPVLVSMLQDPDVIVGVANVWWAGNTSINPIQEASMNAWSQLFSTAKLSAINK